MFFFDTCNAVATREDRKPKYWQLGRRHLGLSLTLWRHNAGTWKSTITSHIQDVAFDGVTSQRQTQSKMVASIFWFSIFSCTYQRKALLFALIKVSIFICIWEISGFSSPLMNIMQICTRPIYIFFHSNKEGVKKVTLAMFYTLNFKNSCQLTFLFWWSSWLHFRMLQLCIA